MEQLKHKKDMSRQDTNDNLMMNLVTVIKMLQSDQTDQNLHEHGSGEQIPKT